MNWKSARLGVCAAIAAFPGSSACSQTPAITPKPATIPATPAIVAADTTGAALIPAGFGSLSQQSISISLQLPDVIVRLTPLDEAVIRTLSSDSYRALRELAESHKAAIARLVSQHGLLRGNLWYVNYYGLARDAKFSPLDLTITSAGRDFRPVDVLPLSSGFGEQRLQPRETQAALYLFDDALDVNQPLVVSLGSQRSSAWTDRLRDVERERVLIRSRAQARTQTP
ncbi:MAG: hypothetical protein ABI625_00395 [bacterium]